MVKQRGEGRAKSEHGQGSKPGDRGGLENWRAEGQKTGTGSRRAEAGLGLTQVRQTGRLYERRTRKPV